MNQQFKDIVARRNFVVLDTETTGIVQPAEIVQIAIIDCEGRVMLDKLVHPINPIPPAATAIHGITNEMVERAQFWLTVKHTVLDLIAGCDVIVYNATYDRKLMHWSDEASGLSYTDYKEKANWYCAMEAYAEYHGEKHPYYGTYKWQSLSNAMTQQGLPISDAHNALGDCLMTLQLINKLCK
jgi:DNA polymerase-3 subunit epsilon